MVGHTVVKPAPVFLHQYNERRDGGQRFGQRSQIIDCGGTDGRSWRNGRKITSMETRNRSASAPYGQYGAREYPIGHGSIECCLDDTKIGHENIDGRCVRQRTEQYVAALSTGNG